MLAYVLRKLMYMPFILLGVIFITFVLFQMSTTPEALAKIQLGEKASERQIYEYLNQKGQVSWTDKGIEKRDLLGKGKLNTKRTPFFVAGKLNDFVDKRDRLNDRIIDLHREIAELKAEELAAHKAAGNEHPFTESKELQEIGHDLGEAKAKQRANRIHIKDALKGARRIEAVLALGAEAAAEAEELDSQLIDLEFAEADIAAMEAAEHDQLKDDIAAARKEHADAMKELKPALDASAAWKGYLPIREKYKSIEDIPPDLTYTAWWTSFVFYLRDIVTLDFGDTNKKRPVTQVIKEGMWPSLALAIPGFFLAEVIGVFFGLFAAMYRQTKIDHVIVVSSILLMSINGIALIMFGQKFFAASWNYFPITGYAEGFGAIRFLMLPIFLYIIITFGERVRFNRIVMLDETNQDYVRTARSKGVSENGVLFKHILRNTLIPLITRWVVAIPSLYLGSLVLESFFGIPGLGFLTVEAISNSDANVIRAVVVFGSVSFMLAALISDVLYAVVDPRVRLE
jgi:peptide/nickel transport system permease protein